MSNELGLKEYNEYVNGTMDIDNNKPNLLFVCEANAQRSPTFEIWFKKNRPQYNIKSTGTAHGYPHALTEELLQWADTVWCMDLEQDIFIYRRFPRYCWKVKVIGCSDQYQRESKQLYNRIEFWAMKEKL